MSDYEFMIKAYAILWRFPDQFKEGFGDWLWDNVAMQRAFNSEALAVINTGRDYYSAYTIVEYLRHWTLLRDSNAEFKVDQNWGSSMGRMFMHMHPDMAHIFRTKQEKRCILAPFSLV